MANCVIIAAIRMSEVIILVAEDDVGVVTWCLLALVHWCPPVLLCHRVMIIVISVTTDDNVTLCLSLDVTDHSGLTLAPWGAGRDWPGLVCSHSLWLQPLSSHWPLWAPSSSSSQFSVLCWLVRAPAPGPQCWPGSLATAPLPAMASPAHHALHIYNYLKRKENFF